MALVELRITENGVKTIDKIAQAVQRIISFKALALSKSAEGYYVCDSGGKDSLVILKLMELAQAKDKSIVYDIHHNLTTVDHPITVQYIKNRQKLMQSCGIDYTIHHPRYKGEPCSMWSLIALKGAPTRIRRWCCLILKEGGGNGRCVVLGVRRAESAKRSGRGLIEGIATKNSERLIRNNDNDDTRQLFETCQAYDKYALNPIIHWSDSDVWDFIRLYHLDHNPLYDLGYTRVGCVGCPMSSKNSIELESNQKYKALYIRSFQKFLDNHAYILSKYGWANAYDMYDWWTGNKSIADPNQISLFDFLDDDEIWSGG